jgi:hypothetical protein
MKRVRLTVTANLDPVIGWGNEAEDWRAMLQHYLDHSVPHYAPRVAVAAIEESA